MTLIEQIKAEIERQRIMYGKDGWKGIVTVMSDLLSFIESLQQEQPEVELNEETIINEFRIIGDKCFNEGIEGWQREKLIARHFFELGKIARKEE